MSSQYSSDNFSRLSIGLEKVEHAFGIVLDFSCRYCVSFNKATKER